MIQRQWGCLSGILVVYHEPGVPGAESLLVSRLEERGYTTLPLRKAIEACKRFKPSKVVLLMFGRGGHWESLVEACDTTVYTIPPWLAAKAIASRARPPLLLVHRRPRRMNDTYSEDIAALAARLLRHGPVTVHASPAPPAASRVSTVVPLAMFPGRLVEAAKRIARLLGAECLGGFASYGLSYILSWLETLE